MVDVDDGLVVVAFKEGLVGADDFGVFIQAAAYFGTEGDDGFKSVGGEKAVAEDFGGLLADAVDAAGALDETDDRPREVVVDDDGAVLEVLAFAEDVGGY